MGPRLPGDKGPQARPAEKKLTHNPFAALAAKLEGGKAETGRRARARARRRGPGRRADARSAGRSGAAGLRSREHHAGIQLRRDAEHVGTAASPSPFPSLNEGEGLG